MEVELPVEITVDILSRLPVDSILECKLVCKTWRTIIYNDPSFLFADTSNAHHRHSSILNSAAEAEAHEVVPFGFFILTEDQLLCYGEYYDHTTTSEHDNKEKEKEKKKEAHLKVTKVPIKFPPLPHYPYYYNQEGRQVETRWAILGSCNGLICLCACRFHGFKRIIFTYDINVYNPMTGEFVDVGTETHMAAHGGYRASGFGYHPSTKEYKVVRINYKRYIPFSGKVKVYTLGSGNGWRDKGEIPYVITGVKKPGVLVNGALHWITRNEEILSFDLADEEFRIVPKPGQVDLCITTGLGVLRGCLCVGSTTQYGITNIWVMNNNKLYMSSSSTTTTTTTTDDDDDEPSWTRLPIEFYKPPRNDGFNDYWGFNEISSYGLKYQSFSRFYDHCNSSRLDIIPYAKSFVSLKALGEQNTKKVSA